jgi:hypothetical protein
MVELGLRSRERLAAATRRLVEAVVHTELDDGDVDACARRVDEIAEALRHKRRELAAIAVPRPGGGPPVVVTNPVDGLLNPLAPPLTAIEDRDGRYRGTVRLGGSRGAARTCPRWLVRDDPRPRARARVPVDGRHRHDRVDRDSLPGRDALTCRPGGLRRRRSTGPQPADRHRVDPRGRQDNRRSVRSLRGRRDADAAGLTGYCDS